MACDKNTNTNNTNTNDSETNTKTENNSNVTAKVPIQQQLHYNFNFLKGHPNSDELPINEMKQLFFRLSSSSSTTPTTSEQVQFESKSLQYSGKTAAGDIQLRNEISNFVSRTCLNDTYDDENEDDIRNNNNNTDCNDDSRCRPVPQTELFCTTGISHGLDLVVRVCCQPGDIVYVENPTYFLAGQIFFDYGLIVQHLPPSASPDTTFDIEALEYQLKQSKKELLPKLIYIIPTHHNPTGTTMSIKNRKRLLELIYLYDIILVADEVYHLLDWTKDNMDNEDNNKNETKKNRNTKKPARMASLWKDYLQKKQQHASYNNLIDQSKSTRSTTDGRGCGGQCISLWSLTKLWCPGIRFGWIECYWNNDDNNNTTSLSTNNTKGSLHDRLNAVGYMCSAGCINTLTGELVRHLLHDRIVDTYLYETLLPNYKHRCMLLCSILIQQQHKHEQQQGNVRSTKNGGSTGEDDSSINNNCIQLATGRPPTGGYFVWIQFPQSVNVDDFLSYCQNNNKNNPSAATTTTTTPRTIQFMPGTKCDALFGKQQPTTKSSSSSLSRYARLCFAQMTNETLVQATHALIDTFQTYQKQSLLT